ncbi:unnamed protein product [marine sediment metagenome]|uniref:Cadherin-like beta-sandwich-like domain-containing protein n=1 Tax=marine sediment metagenome TaxID=412755 RepID=X1RRN8_9ZZZZ
MTKLTWTPEQKATLVSDRKTAVLAKSRDDAVLAGKFLLQYQSGYGQSDLTTLTEDIAADFVPAVAAGVYEYALAATNLEDTVTLTATLAGASIRYTYGATVNKVVASGVGEAVALVVGANVVTIKVLVSGYGPVIYTLTITRAAE